MDLIQTDPLPVYLTTAEAAHLLRLSARTLEKYRTYGSGPSYRKLGGKVVYATSDLIGWAETDAMASTVGSIAPKDQGLEQRPVQTLRLL